MGFLNKIFNSSNQSSSADNSDNLITFYKAKYPAKCGQNLR